MEAGGLHDVLPRRAAGPAGEAVGAAAVQTLAEARVSLAAPRTARTDVVLAVALAVLYVVAARLGLALDAVAGFATLVWPPTGIALAALLLFGYRLWPGIFI